MSGRRMRGKIFLRPCCGQAVQALYLVKDAGRKEKRDEK